MLNIDNPINPRLIKELNSEVLEIGLNNGFKSLLAKLNVKIETKVEDQANFTNGPKLIISNHHGSIDSVSLLSLIPEKGLHWVGIKFWENLGDVCKGRLLTAYLSNKEHSHWFERWKYRYYYSRFEGKISREQAKTKNRQMISKAAEIINNGGSVLIFPTGGETINRTNWKDGVGFLFKQITNPDLQVFLVNIENSGIMEFVRFLDIPGLNKMLGNKTLAIKYNKLSNNELRNLKTYSGKEISQQLKSYYLQHFGGL